MEGVEVNLFDVNTSQTITTHTNENGNYYFGNLNPSTFTVSVNQATLLGNVNNTLDPDGSVQHESTVGLSALEINTFQGFGYLPVNPGSIGNLIWEDRNANGLVDTDEQGIGGVSLRLYVDSNTNGRYDAGDRCIAATETDPSGEFLFSNLPTTDRGGNPMRYLVVVTDENEIINDYWHSIGTAEADNNSQTDDGYLVILDANSGILNNTTADMGYYDDPGAVGNFVWNDLNRNGLQDAGEPGMTGIAVTLNVTYPDGSSILLVDSTDANGHYDFKRLLLDENYDGSGTYGTGGDEPLYEISVGIPCLLYTSPSPRDLSTSRMPSSA